MAYVYSRQSRLIQQNLEMVADELSRNLHDVLVIPILNLDRQQIKNIGESFLQNEVVDEIQLKNSRGDILFGAPDEGDRRWDFIRSINIIHQNQVIGHADLRFSMTSAERNLAWLRNAIILILLISGMVIFVTVAILLRVLIHRPLKILQKDVNRVAGGENGFGFNEIHHLEFSSIAAGFKDMAARIQAREHSLQETNQTLSNEMACRKQDAADKIRLEEQLRSAQKMEAVGRMAGGVAHDLNNVLSGLVSYPELILMDLSEDSPVRPSILAIQKSGEKATKIVQDMLALARRGFSVTEMVNLNDIITDYLLTPEYERLKKEYPEVKLETKLDPDLKSIPGSFLYLSKLVMNLVFNAVETMPKGGVVTILSQNRYFDEPIRGYGTIEEGEYAVVKVTDNGIGISEQDLARIFEPFYTKKTMGRSGSGLEMALVMATVEDHDGYIDVQSTADRKTTFSVYLPVSRQKLPREETRFSLDKYRGNGEFVLVVDDIEEQRSIAADMFTKLGYRVKSVTSGEEAVDYMKTHPADLLVLDMIMDPGIDGLETYKRVLQLHPGQKAIISSAFSESERVREALRLGAGAYVKKPYLMDKMAITLRDELARRN